MPLNDIARRYADSLFNKSKDPILKKQNADFIQLEQNSGSILSGQRFTQRAGIYARAIDEMAEAKLDSLLKAYEKSGIPLDDAAVGDIVKEITEFCEHNQRAAVEVMNEYVGKFSQAGPNIHRAMVNVVEIAINNTIARLRRELAIRRDEVLLDELKSRRTYAAATGKKYDVFICHASEDKASLVNELAAELEESGLSVWFDAFTIKVGDNLGASIDHGLANSRWGIVILSKNFFAKKWPRMELDGLLAKEIGGTKVILPVWHNISAAEIASNSPLLGARYAAISDKGILNIVKMLREAMGLDH